MLVYGPFIALLLLLSSHFIHAALRRVSYIHIPIFLPYNGKVGPGTGLAPFRAFCQELRHLDSEEERNQLQDAHDSGSTGDDQNRIKGKRFFYFGCRHKDKDFLYEDDWKSFVHDGVLSNVYTAFSRDQPQKV